jgi:hypothetical protein
LGSDLGPTQALLIAESDNFIASEYGLGPPNVLTGVAGSRLPHLDRLGPFVVLHLGRSLLELLQKTSPKHAS